MLGFGRDALRVQPVCVADSGSLAQYRQGDSVAAAGVEIKGVSMTTTAAVGAVMVLGEMVTGGLFLENMKMEKQRTSLPYPTLARQILQGSPLQVASRFNAGFLPWGVVLGVTKGAVLLAAKRFFNKTFGEMESLSKDQGELLAGACAGATQGVFISPLLLARTRVNKALAAQAAMKPAEEIKFSFRVMNADIREKGLFRGAIMPGMGACIAKRTIDWGSRYAIILYLKKAFAPADGTPLSSTQLSLISFMGGVISVSVTMPVDRLLPVIQGATSEGESLVKTMRARMAAEGITTWFRGWFVRALHTGYHTFWVVSLGSFASSAIARMNNADDDDDDE